MPTAPTSSGAKGPTRADRRRERTHRRLLAAALELFAEQGVAETRIGQITERADVAAGSFYNHFTDKDEIVEAVLSEMTEKQGALVDELTAEIEDPAAVVAYAHRHFVRLAMTDPTFGRLVIRFDALHRLLQEALAPRALRDIQRGIDSGRFKVENLPSALFTTGGALLGTLIGVAEGILGDRADEVHAAAILRMLGVASDDAARVAALEMR
jgi:AcrR family transcriptional regulator